MAKNEPTEILKLLGANLAKAREKAGYATAKIYSALKGIKYTTYLSYEQGIHQPPLDQLLEIIDDFGLSLDQALGRVKTDGRLKVFGKNLRKCRLNAGETERSISSVIDVDEDGLVTPRIDMSEHSYCYYEEGEKQPDVDLLVELSRFLGVSVDKLLGVAEKELDPQIQMRGRAIDDLLKAFGSGYQAIQVNGQFSLYEDGTNKFVCSISEDEVYGVIREGWRRGDAERERHIADRLKDIARTRLNDKGKDERPSSQGDYYKEYLGRMYAGILGLDIERWAHREFDPQQIMFYYFTKLEDFEYQQKFSDLLHKQLRSTAVVVPPKNAKRDMADGYVAIEAWLAEIEEDSYEDRWLAKPIRHTPERRLGEIESYVCQTFNLDVSRLYHSYGKNEAFLLIKSLFLGITSIDAKDREGKDYYDSIKNTDILPDGPEVLSKLACFADVMDGRIRYEDVARFCGHDAFYLQMASTSTLVYDDDNDDNQNGLSKYTESIKKIADETLEITKAGSYKLNSKVIQLPHGYDETTAAIPYTAKKLGSLAAKAKKLPPPEGWDGCQYKITSYEPLEALTSYAKNDKTAIINFAIAKKPGGDFLTERYFPEQRLCRSSTLYASLASESAKAFYNAQQRIGRPRYADDMLLSPVVDVFRDDGEELLKKPFSTSVISLVAPSRLKASEQMGEDEIADCMERRIRMAISLAADKKYSALVIGLWDFDANGEDARAAANYFQSVICDERMYRFFGKIIFSVKDDDDRKPNYRKFLDVFGKSGKWTD